MRKLIIAFLVIMSVWGIFWVEGSGGNAHLQTTGDKVCRLYRMMSMEGGLCQWYCWNCQSFQPLGEVNSCTVGPGGCSGTYGCFYLPAQAPAPPAEAPPGKEKAAPRAFAGLLGKSGQIFDPINNVGKTGLKRLKTKPKATEKSGEIVYEKVLRFKLDGGGEWRKALVCIVSYDPPGDKPTLTVACGREFDADAPNTPHDLEATAVETSEEFPYLIEATAGAVTYLIALHETNTETE